jgi:hypothetical protein
VDSFTFCKGTDAKSTTKNTTGDITNKDPPTIKDCTETVFLFVGSCYCFHAQNFPWFAHNGTATRQVLTDEALGQQELGAGVELPGIVQRPGSLHPESQHVQCHAEHSAATPLLPAYESLD